MRLLLVRTTIGITQGITDMHTLRFVGIFRKARKLKIHNPPR